MVSVAGPIESAQESGDRQGRYDPLANSAAMRAVKRTIDRLAATDAPVLISGKSGVGKELVARAAVVVRHAEFHLRSRGVDTFHPRLKLPGASAGRWSRTLLPFICAPAVPVH